MSIFCVRHIVTMEYNRIAAWCWQGNLVFLEQGMSWWKFRHLLKKLRTLFVTHLVNFWSSLISFYFVYWQDIEKSHIWMLIVLIIFTCPILSFEVSIYGGNCLVIRCSFYHFIHQVVVNHYLMCRICILNFLYYLVLV